MYANKSSNAYALELVAQELEAAQKKQLAIKQQRLRKKKAKAKKLVFCMVNLALVFTITLTILFRYVQITELSRENTQAQKEYETLVAKNQNLQMEINSLQDSKTIEEIATSKLNMMRPEKYQIVYIQTPKEDRVELVAQENSEKKSGGFLGAIGTAISNVLAYLK